MAELKTGQIRGFRRGRARARRGERIGFLRAAAAGALALLSACFSPEAYTEHMCRTCTSECPDGLTCFENRCVPVCNPACVGDYHCDGDACVPNEGALCPERSVSLPLCVDRANDVVVASSAGVSASDPWVVLDSRLPEGVSFDPSTGRLSGSPERAEAGSITLRHGLPGSEELSVALAAQVCPQIVATSIAWCRGTDETAQLVASAPGEYEWRVSGRDGLQVQGDVLSGNIDESATFSLEIELVLSGTVVDSETIELSVAECGGGPGDLPPPPLQIDPLAQLPKACEGVEYGARFLATGGVPDYRWTLETELAGLVLDEASGRLTGTPLASGDFELTVRVDDQADNHDSITAALHVVSAVEECVTDPVGPTADEACDVSETVACPRAPLRIATTDLGVACVGENLSARLEAAGGGGNYRWGLSNAALYPAPSGLTLERTGELHGVPAAEAVGQQRIRVFVSSTLVDTPVYGTVTLEIAACDGLVFLTDAAGAGRLFLASTSSDGISELSEGVLAADEGVHSFALSADGVHAAFDVAGPGGLRRLYWVDLATGEARLPAYFPGLPDGAAIIDYRWSLDGRELAATFGAGDEVFLGVSPAAGAVGSSIDISGRYVSNLFWGGDRICYVAPALDSSYSGVLCHSITAEGIEDQVPISGIFDPIELRTDLLLSSDEGYLAILTENRGQYYLPAEAASSVNHANRVFSPALHRAAGPSQADPSIFEVLTSRGVPRQPRLLAQLDPCDKLDAWSLDERSLACSSGGSLAVHRLGPDGALASSASVEGSAGYPEEEFRRLWAPGGQWYAYDANGTLRVVPLDAAPPRSREIAVGGAASPYAGLGTDASGAHLYYHHGSDLEVVDTRADFRVTNLNGDVLLPDPAPCNEAQLDDGPRLWCGAQSPASFVFPAPEAPRVAFVDRQNHLYVVDVAAGVETSPAAGVETSPGPRLVHASSVKCTMDSGETACDNFVQWVPRREP
jgi:hypothetical protein